MKETILFFVGVQVAVISKKIINNYLQLSIASCFSWREKECIDSDYFLIVSSPTFNCLLLSWRENRNNLIIPAPRLFNQIIVTARAFAAYLPGKRKFVYPLRIAHLRGIDVIGIAQNKSI